MAKKEKGAVSSAQAFWVGEIECYEQQFGPWEKRSKKIIDRYMDDRDDQARAVAKFNILWSNVQTLQPAIYASTPNPNIDRRFDTDDDVGRYSALVLERAVSYYVKNDLFDKVMKQVTLDRLLPGRGSAWVRYCPVFDEKLQVTDDEQDKDYEESAPDLVTEDAVPDYVHWQDFGHTWARTWQEVRGVWRRVFMSRAELVKRFGEAGQTIPLDAEIKGKNDESMNAGKRAVIYEIWDKAERKAIWLHKVLPDIIEEKDDPLGLKYFFPCPEPIYSTLSNNSLIPTPDYVQYQDQAVELDMITARIAAITKAVKIAGVYDAAAQGIDRLLSEGKENILIPVEQWAILGGGKGLPGAISLFPLAEIVSALTALYQARDKVKQDLYEITGISDIVRGATDPNETLGAQELKGQFATLRLDDKQKDVARFSKDLVVIMTEIIAKHFSLDTIKQVSGVKLLTAQEKLQIQMQQQMAQQTGQEPAPLSEEITDLLDLPTWEDIEAIIRNDTARNFRIDIETDSTIKTDQENEKKARLEFLGAVSGFMAQAVNTPPDLQNLAMEMLMFGVRGFKVSRELETVFEATMRKLKKAEDQPPQPDPAVQAENARSQLEMQKLQQSGQIEQMKLQSSREQAQMNAQNQMQVEQMKAQLSLQIEAVRLQNQRDIEAMKLENQRVIETDKVNFEEKKAKIQRANELESEYIAIEGDDTRQTKIDLLAASVQSQGEALSQLTQAIGIMAAQDSAPKRVVRDASGKIIGIETVN